MRGFRSHFERWHHGARKPQTRQQAKEGNCPTPQRTSRAVVGVGRVRTDSGQGAE
jgi:hypothetical protein